MDAWERNMTAAFDEYMAGRFGEDWWFPGRVESDPEMLRSAREWTRVEQKAKSGERVTWGDVYSLHPQLRCGHAGVVPIES